MTRRAAPVAPVRAGFFVAAALPFLIPMLLTLALVLTVGEAWPRQIAPGSGLKLAGFVATGLTALAVLAAITFRHGEARLRKAAAVLCAVTGLMGWPVWSVGVLPSVNGSALGPPESVAMVLERTEVTTASRSNTRYHWAWLRPVSAGAPVGAGRYFIPPDLHARWSAAPPTRVTLTVARGRLGAVVVTGFE
jgi:hypothetical protein